MCNIEFYAWLKKCTENFKIYTSIYGNTRRRSRLAPLSHFCCQGCGFRCRGCRQVCKVMFLTASTCRKLECRNVDDRFATGTSAAPPGVPLRLLEMPVMWTDQSTKCRNEVFTSRWRENVPRLSRQAKLWIGSKKKIIFFHLQIVINWKKIHW